MGACAGMRLRLAPFRPAAAEVGLPPSARACIRDWGGEGYHE